MEHHALQLYNYHVWATEKWLEHLKQLPDEIYTKRMASVFPSIAHVFSHLYVIENIWLSAMREESFDQSAIERWAKETSDISLNEMESKLIAVFERCRSFLQNLDNLDRMQTFEHPQFGRLQTRLSAIIEHLVNHGTYHRGNIAAMVRQLGCSGIPNDYVFYLFETQANPS